MQESLSLFSNAKETVLAYRRQVYWSQEGRIRDRLGCWPLVHSTQGRWKAHSEAVKKHCIGISSLQVDKRSVVDRGILGQIALISVTPKDLRGADKGRTMTYERFSLKARNTFIICSWWFNFIQLHVSLFTTPAARLAIHWYLSRCLVCLFENATGWWNHNRTSRC